MTTTQLRHEDLAAIATMRLPITLDRSGNRRSLYDEAYEIDTFVSDEPLFISADIEIEGALIHYGNGRDEEFGAELNIFSFKMKINELYYGDTDEPVELTAEQKAFLEKAFAKNIEIHHYDY